MAAEEDESGKERFPRLIFPTTSLNPASEMKLAT